MSPENQGLFTRLFGDITVLFRRHTFFGDIPDVRAFTLKNRVCVRRPVDGRKVGIANRRTSKNEMLKQAGLTIKTQRGDPLHFPDGRKSRFANRRTSKNEMLKQASLTIKTQRGDPLHFPDGRKSRFANRQDNFRLRARAPNPKSQRGDPLHFPNWPVWAFRFRSVRWLVVEKIPYAKFYFECERPY